MKRPPLDFDISVSADKARRARTRAKVTGAVEPNGRRCDRPGCEAAGIYRAPKSPERLDEFHWFCLEHVREYNRAWNFFNGAPEDELERMVNGNVWDRPTWKLGQGGRKTGNGEPHAEGQAWARSGYRDPFEVLGENATRRPDRAAAAPRRKLPASEQRALDILGAADTQTKAEIRKLYASLVKDLHPDANGGSRADEDRLQEVVWAWEQI
ncbi:MAG: DnaJ domain-containing protein, partial [Pseudomonadota bacterium]